MILSIKEAQPVAAGGPNSGSVNPCVHHIGVGAADQSATDPVVLLDRPEKRTPSQLRAGQGASDGSRATDRPEQADAIDGSFSVPGGSARASDGQGASDLALVPGMVPGASLASVVGNGAGVVPGVGMALPPDARPPLTNRGSVTPSEGVRYFGIHELKVTVWTGLEAIKYFLISIDPVFRQYLDHSWAMKGGGGRSDQVYDTGMVGLSVVTYKGDAPYLSVHFKGEFCEVYGDRLLSVFLGQLNKVQARWNATRIDCAWDGFGVTVEEFESLLNKRCYRSKSDIAGWFMGNRVRDGQRTCYTHKTPEKRSIARYARCYDQRGHVRFEFCMRHDFAKLVGDALGKARGEDWGVLLVGYLRDFMDILVEPGDRPERVELHPAWSDLVGSVGRANARLPESIPARSAREYVVNRGLRKVMRIHPDVLALVEVFGLDWFYARLREYCGEKLDLQYVEQLRRTGGGVDPELPPF